MEGGIQRALLPDQPDQLARAYLARGSKKISEVPEGWGGGGVRGGDLKVPKELRTPPPTTTVPTPEGSTPRAREVLARLGALGCRGATAVLAEFGEDRLTWELDQLRKDLDRGVPVRSPVGLLVYRCRQEDSRLHLQAEAAVKHDDVPVYRFRAWGT